MSRIEPAALAQTWQEEAARITPGFRRWGEISEPGKQHAIAAAQKTIEALGLVRFDWDADVFDEADPRGLAILWQVKLSETAPGGASWDALTRTEQEQRVTVARKVLTALREASPAAVQPTPYVWGKLTVESVREMLKLARDAQIEYHHSVCQAAGVDAYNCISGKGCDKQMVKLDHCLEQLPPAQPAEPKVIGAVVRLVFNAETQEIRYYGRVSAVMAPWYTFGGTHGVTWSDVVEVAQRHGCTIEIVSAPSA